MLILRGGLYLAVVLVAWVTWASVGAGYAVETALVRGLLAVPPVVFVAYLAELVVVTAPLPRRHGARPPAAHPAASTAGADGPDAEDRESVMAMERRQAA